MIRHNAKWKCFSGVLSRASRIFCLQRPLRGERPRAARRKPSGPPAACATRSSGLKGVLVYTCFFSLYLDRSDERYPPCWFSYESARPRKANIQKPRGMQETRDRCVSQLAWLNIDRDTRSSQLKYLLVLIEPIASRSLRLRTGSLTAVHVVGIGGNLGCNPPASQRKHVLTILYDECATCCVFCFDRVGWPGLCGTELNLTAALQAWAVSRQKLVTYVLKGQNPLTEHYR